MVADVVECDNTTAEQRPDAQQKETENVVPLPFGIPQLDELLGYGELNAEDEVNCLQCTTSLTIVGQDGTGKSVFALHLASAYHALRYYHARADKPLLPQPFVFYVSSDLKIAAGRKVWKNFFLDYPWHRYVPFISPTELRFRHDKLLKLGAEPKPFQVELLNCLPFTKPSGNSPGAAVWLADHLRYLANADSKASDARVAFLDFASQTTGDDWLFVARLISSVPKLRGAPPNLLILDSVAGFEALVGESNSFGEKMSRRARVAQLIRAAADNWHTVFIVEEPDEGTHHPEEYVTDTVLHLRRYGQAERTRRMLEIEKSRARSYASGEHPFEIRDGMGSSTRSWENPDDPYTLPHTNFGESAGLEKAGRRVNAYIQVFPSLHYLSKDFARKTRLTRTKGEIEKGRGYVQFGVPYLDNMLAEGDSAYGAPGLPEGTVTSLIGEEGTRKALLAERFLAEGFRHFPEIFDLVLRLAKNYKAQKGQEINEFIQAHGPGLIENEKSLSKPVKARLKDRLSRWKEDSPKSRQNELQNLAGHCYWRLRTAKELQEVLSEGRSSKAGANGESADSPIRPLMARWDALLYYERVGENSTYENHAFILALSILRMSWGIIAPAVFICTHDTSAEQIADRIFLRFEKRILRILQEHQIATDQLHRDALLRLMERFLLVRRIELVDATAPQLWHVIHGSVTQAVYLLGYDSAYVTTRVDPIKFAGRVRVVISDLRQMRDTYPSVASDPLFLPTVVFRLRRMGVTTLLVDSGNGRPDSTPSHPMSGALRSLVDHQIYTWKVPFFGEERIAISVIPPLTPSAAGVIRELRAETHGLAGNQENTVVVDPHFELYMGVEEGRPTAVPLEVILYDETPAFEQYIESEKALFARLFSPRHGGEPVIQVLKTRDYDGLREYCHLPIDTRLPFTLVFAVDGYWALGRNASLRNQCEYLFRTLPSESEAAQEHDQADHDYVDVFRVFKRSRQEKLLDTQPLKCRSDFFVQQHTENGVKQYYYKSRIPDKDPKIDRVPFMWDFGFLLCNWNQWKSAFDIPLRGGSKGTVRDVWTQLSRPAVLEEDPGGASTPDAAVSWRDFFEACAIVAQAEERRIGRKVLPFDLATAAPESLSCLIFEIWFSEIAADALRIRQYGCNSNNEEAKKWADQAFHDLYGFSKELYKQWRPDEVAPEPPCPYLQYFLAGKTEDDLSGAFEEAIEAAKSLKDKDRDERFLTLVGKSPGYCLQLYKTWLLLLEVLDFRKYEDPVQPFELKSDYESAADSVASRHWYKTASTVSNNPATIRDSEGLVRTEVPVRLPGHFSVRGDWFLAVAKGSRSSRLADRALDLLTTRRANRTRLHLGLGLPTRDILHGSQVRQLRTRLRITTPDGMSKFAYYGDLLKMQGKYTAMPGDPKQASGFAPGDFRWLFRTGFKDYDRHAMVIRKWVHRLFTWTVRYRHESRHNWRGGFVVYDKINHADFCEIEEFGSLKQFPRDLALFLDDLNAASLASGETQR